MRDRAGAADDDEVVIDRGRLGRQIDRPVRRRRAVGERVELHRGALAPNEEA